MRIRQFEATGPVADATHLLHDFFPEIPGQNKEIIRLCFSYSIRMINRDVSAGHKKILLMRTPVNGEIEEIGTDTAVLEQ